MASSPALRPGPLPQPDSFGEPESQGSGFVGSLLLHGAVLGLVVAGSVAFRRHGERWGEHALEAGAIQATMVSSIPLPARQRSLDTGVLTSEKPSPAPTPEKERTVPPPSPNDLAIPNKVQPKPPKIAERETPEPPKRPQPTPPQPTRATTGETAGIRIAQSTMQLKNGSSSVAVEDRSFGARYAYYIAIVNRTVAQNWYTQEADPVSSEGKRVTLLFDIGRDGTPSNARILTRSGSPSLDTSAVHALQRVDGFGPLPAGDHITVEYSFDYRRQ